MKNKIDESIKDVKGFSNKHEAATLKLFFILCKHMGFNGEIASLSSWKETPKNNELTTNG